MARWWWRVWRLLAGTRHAPCPRLPRARPAARLGAHTPALRRGPRPSPRAPCSRRAPPRAPRAHSPLSSSPRSPRHLLRGGAPPTPLSALLGRARREWGGVGGGPLARVRQPGAGAPALSSAPGPWPPAACPQARGEDGRPPSPTALALLAASPSAASGPRAGDSGPGCSRDFSPASGPGIWRAQPGLREMHQMGKTFGAGEQGREGEAGAPFVSS
ncbi:translation initiation factor IF-2-like [Acinonyx jubatus]|uniref:Translation initiation factor IF-2-like n=1 Tax=Acinonyx jubatus TaxID=32536 RepID=A0ABM3NGH5_ACIJB|nr:translation initiation factor IF-2-like [Acinonyx jubatus]